MTMTSEPLVSVIVPTHNRANLLPHAMDSALQGQKGVSIELIVVDDASTDQTREIIQAYGEPVTAIHIDVNRSA